MEIFTNPWIIGIGTSTISGVFSGWLVWRITNGKENRAYLQKIEIINKEIVHSIRPSVAEEIIPSLDVMEAVISAVAARHQVDVEDVLGVSEICDILIDEIMANPFLAAKRKVDFCKELVKRKKQAKKKNKNDQGGPKPPYTLSRILAVAIGVTTALLTLVSIPLTLFKTHDADVNPVFAIGLIAATTTLAPLLGLLLGRWFKRINANKEISDQEKSANDLRYYRSYFDRNTFVHSEKHKHKD